MQMYDPAHPGMLIKDQMGDRSIAELAKHLGVTRAALSRVINGKAAVSAGMALRLEGAFGIKADIWLRLQIQRDLWVASRKNSKKVAPAGDAGAAEGRVKLVGQCRSVR